MSEIENSVQAPSGAFFTPARAAIVAEARTWIGTPFHHQARLKGVGADCVGLLIGVCRSFGMIDFDKTDYDRKPDGVMLKRLCNEHMTEIPFADAQIADALLFNFGQGPQHLGLIGDYAQGGFSLIHAYSRRRAKAEVGKVLETRLDSAWIGRIVSAYRLPGMPA